MIETLNHIDTQVFIFLNSQHNSFFDFLMYWISNKYVWIPFYAFLIYLIIKKYKKQSWLILLLIAILITASDQLSVFMKNYFQRPRPCHQDELQALVHLVNNKCGGAYGFVSSHASNSFALAVFLIPFFKPNYRHFSFLILSWALLVAYSRIYLGVHFPGDIIGGALTGMLLGYIFSRFFFLIRPPG
ncbi:MAG: phosphatase PAP2 family protein [Bacteroidales bacterium]|nr:phosphatase PAP2 family protein [Bacteroidales bacterium]